MQNEVLVGIIRKDENSTHDLVKMRIANEYAVSVDLTFRVNEIEDLRDQLTSILQILQPNQRKL